MQAMNEFNHSYVHRSTECEKKGRRVRNHREEACRCVSPFVKLHYHDCPMVMKPCPIHGNFVRHNERETKIEREENVIISFHPSSKTERLLQPIKSFLTNCNSGTKINFQYYPSDTCISKESLKAPNGQNVYENVKRTFNNNIFVEKTKSFVANKTNKVKKLKQCFHSPCNSIAQRTRSQTSITEKVNQILREEAKQTRNVYYNVVPEISPDDKKYDSTSKWFSSNKGDFNHNDFLSDDKLDSDFITVTQHDNSNTIHHKVFEIKHKKGLNDIPFVGFPGQPPQFVYPVMNVNEQQNQTSDHSYGRPMKHVSYGSDRESKEERGGPGKNIEVSSSEKSHRSFSSSSSGSVYITPFVFVPRGLDEGDYGMIPKQKVAVEQLDEAIQVEDLERKKEEGWPKETQTSDTNTEKALISVVPPKPTPHEKPEQRSVLLQTESYLYERFCRSSGQVYVHEYESYCTSRVAATHTGSDLQPVTLDESYIQCRHCDISRRINDSNANAKTQEVQMVSDSTYRRGETGTMTEKASQTDNPFVVKDSAKTLESGTRDSSQPNGKAVQTVSKEIAPEDPEFIKLNSPNVTYVIKPFDQKESDQAIEKLAKTWWGKSHSDSDLYERLKCECCKGDNENSLQPAFSKRSDLYNTPNKKVTDTKVYSSVPTSSGTENHSKAGSVTLKTKETVECFTDKKQTSTREEELSAAVSDLSELKKIIQDFFEKGHFNSKKTCDCDNAVAKARKAGVETMTDNPPQPTSSSPAQKCLGLSKTIQTPLRFLTEILQNPLSLPTEKKHPKVNATTQSSLERIEQNNFQVQTSEIKEIPVKQSVHVQTSERENPPVNNIEVRTSEMEKPAGKDVEVQTETVEKPVEPSEIPEKRSTHVQTSIRVLLDEAEQGRDKVKVQRTVVVDPESQTKTFFVCSLCGRDIKTSVNTGTNTDGGHQLSEKKEKLPAPTTVSESQQVKVRPKNNETGCPPEQKRQTVHTPQKSERPSGRNDLVHDKRQNNQKVETSPRADTLQKSKIPLPSATTYVRLKKKETVFQEECRFVSPEWMQQKSFSSNINLLPRLCNCEMTPGPSSSVGQKPSTDVKVSKGTSQVKPQSGSSQPKRDHEQYPNRKTASQTNGHKTDKTFLTDKTNIYPVLVTHFCPIDFMKTMKSMETSNHDNPSSDDSKSQISKQKRTFEKDLETRPDGKKIKMDSVQQRGQHDQFDSCTFIDLLRHGKLADFQAWSTAIMAPQEPENERSSVATDEALNEESEINETYRENDEDVFSESEHYSDTARTTESSLVGEDEDEGEEEEEEEEELEETHFGSLSKRKPQARSSVSFNKSHNSGATTTSKSLNAFWFLKEPHKNIKNAKRQVLKKRKTRNKKKHKVLTE